MKAMKPLDYSGKRKKIDFSLKRMLISHPLKGDYFEATDFYALIDELYDVNISLHYLRNAQHFNIFGGDIMDRWK